MPSPDFGTVALVTVEENKDAFVVGLSEDQTGEGAYLILQCGLTEPSASDAATGLDTYCLLDEEEAVQYGGVTRAALDGNILTLSLNEEAADELGLASRTIILTVPGQDTGRLAEGLRRIFTYGNPENRPRLAGI